MPLDLTLPDAYLLSAADAEKAAKPASLDNADTKATFWTWVLKTTSRP